MNLLEGHLNCCVKNAVLSKDDAEVNDKMKELVKIINLAQNK